MAEEDVEFRRELEKRVQEAGGSIGTQTAITKGNWNRTTQVMRSHNKNSVI
jgi:hypothetical protein